MIEFIHNIWWLEMFRTSKVHLQERFRAVCCEFGMWLFCVLLETYGCYAVVQPHNMWMYRVVGKSPHTKIRNLQPVNAPEVGPLRSETCRATKYYE